jgi:AI-2 transport protein TqsA
MAAGPGATQMTSGFLVKLFQISALTALGIVALVYGAGILIPLALALLIWMFINALARMFQRLWRPWFAPMRFLSLALAFLTLVVITVLVVEIVATNVSTMGTRVSNFERSLLILVDKVAEMTGVSNEKIINAIVSHLSVERLLGAIVFGVIGIAGTASNLGIVFVYVIFLLVEQQFFDLKLKALVADQGRRDRIRSVLSRVTHDVQSYIWTMSIVSLLTAVLSYAVMMMVE